MENYVDPKQKMVRIKVVGVGGAGGNATNRMKHTIFAQR